MSNEKKVIVANYRFYVTGGPEVYMFKFMDKCDEIGYVPIPFSVKYNQNRSTKYEKYFISSRSKDSVYYENIKKTPRSIYKTLQGAFYNKETAKKIKKLIKDEKPKVLYALQVINTLSPSIFKTAKKQGLKVIHRISDFNMICPKSDFLRNDEICELCLNGDLSQGIKHKCYHNSKLASIIRCKSMQYHRKHHLYDYVDYFVVPTKFTRNKLIEGGFPQEKIITIPTFVDSKAIVPDYTNDKYFLFLARLSPEKGAKYAVEAMAQLKELGVKLKITGTLTEKDEEIMDSIKRNRLEDSIEFVGFKQGQELANLISKSIAVLCPAIWYENMPNTVLEAYAYGKPVIASNIGCFPELIENEKTGLLFTPKDFSELAEKMKDLYNNPEKTVKLGQNAREKVEKEFSPEQHLSALKNLFES